MSVSDISHVLPVSKLPEVPLPQVRRRRGRGSEGGGNNQVPVTVEQEMPEGEADMDFGEFPQGFVVHGVKCDV